MKFINIILENSNLNQAKLYAPSHKCYNKPDTGITIQHKGAYNVIKDCAYITTKYLPHFIFGAYPNPFTTLKGKFTKPDIEEFVKKARDDYALDQLLSIILNRCSHIVENKKEIVSNKQSLVDMDSSDPYGFYGLNDNDEVETKTENRLSDVEILCLAFDVV
jgi:hypothetical protein